MSGDYQLEATLFFPFTTRAFATGVPTALVSGAIDIYEDATATPIVTGETLAVSLNGVVGFNMITITATAATGFNAGGHYTAILQAGTVATVSVVGEVVAHFTLDKSAAAVDLANGTDGLGVIKAGVDDVPTVAEFNARTLVAADYFDPAVDTVADVTLVATVTTVTGGALDATVAKDATVSKEATLTARTLLAAAYFDPATDAVADVTLVATTTVNSDMRGTDGVDTTAMRGTDGAASPAQVNVEVLDVLTVDTFAEPGQITPLATTTLATKIAFIYKAFRNLMNNNGTTIELFNDAGTVVDQKAAVSETAGTVTRGKFGAGP